MSKMNLSKKGQEAKRSVTQEDVLLNILATFAGIGEVLEGIATELSDIKDNMNRWALKEGYITEAEIEEREAEDDENEPA